MNSGYYTYLISSLPMLNFGVKPPFPFDKFLTMCEGLVEYDYGKTCCSTLKKWNAFDKALRNELVKIRAAHKKLDPLKYMRYEGGADPSITHIAAHAFRTPSLLEGEKILDQARWNFLDELAIGHYFDIDFLTVYANKLLIMERWEKINTLDKVKALEEAIT